MHVGRAALATAAAVSFGAAFARANDLIGRAAALAGIRVVSVDTVLAPIAATLARFEGGLENRKD